MVSFYVLVLFHVMADSNSMVFYFRIRMGQGSHIHLVGLQHFFSYVA